MNFNEKKNCNRVNTCLCSKFYIILQSIIPWHLCRDYFEESVNSPFSQSFLKFPYVFSENNDNLRKNGKTFSTIPKISLLPTVSENSDNLRKNRKTFSTKLLHFCGMKFHTDGWSTSWEMFNTMRDKSAHTICFGYLRRLHIAKSENFVFTFENGVNLNRTRRLCVPTYLAQRQKFLKMLTPHCFFDRRFLSV